MKLLAPLFISTTWIVDLIFGTYLILKLEFEVFLINSLVCLVASINQEEIRGRATSLDRFDNPQSWHGAKAKLRYL